jgi:hypothetical protein
MFEETLKSKTKILGQNHAALASTHLSIALCHMHLQNEAKFTASLQQAHTIMKATADAAVNHAEYAHAQLLLASRAFDECDFSGARELFAGSVTQWRKCHGNHAAQIADASFGLAMSLAALKHFRESATQLASVSTMRASLLGPQLGQAAAVNESARQINQCVDVLYRS